MRVSEEKLFVVSAWRDNGIDFGGDWVEDIVVLAKSEKEAIRKTKEERGKQKGIEYDCIISYEEYANWKGIQLQVA